MPIDLGELKIKVEKANFSDQTYFGQGKVSVIWDATCLDVNVVILCCLL